MKPRFFATPAEFRAWLRKHHRSADELLVGFYKVGSGKPSITWKESVDEALCFGWIDAVRRSIDDESYSIRFTPRRPGSNWSAVNIKRVAELKKAGLMQPAGMEAFARRTQSKSRTYSYERAPTAFAPEHQKQFSANGNAWEFFQAQAPSYQRLITQWINGAKGEDTRLRRLSKVIAASAQGRRIMG